MRRVLAAVLLISCSPPPAPKPPCDVAPLTKGPWALRATETSASVLWESREAGCVEVGLLREDAGDETKETVAKGTATESNVTVAYGEDLGVKPADVAGAFQLNEVKLTGLSPGTCYRYRLAGANVSGRFCTARPGAQPIRFLALGDTASHWGEFGKLQASMPKDADFVVHLGDIQYYSSIQETWQSWFRDAATMLRSGAFFPCIGNHELELIGELDAYYLRFFPSPGVGTPRWYRFSSGGVAFFSVDTESPLTAGSPQLEWLARELAAAKAEPGWRTSVVFFHKPIYTLSLHAPLTAVRATVEPLLIANGVKLVMQGHNHVYERFQVGDITYVTSGGGGAPLYDPDANTGAFANDVALRQKALKKYHLVEVTFGAMLKIRALDQTGAELDVLERSY